jgi:prepilin-type processing-associated H-X9-DG protein
MNVLAFNNQGRDPLQRLGDTKQPGQMYCPAMQKWPAGGARSPRAYTMNKYVQNTDTNGVIPNYGGLLNYLPGRKLASFSRPQNTILIGEYERSGDYLQPNPTYGQLTLGYGNSAPTWASTDLYWAFRHNKQINILFLDGHVQSFTLNDAKKLNDPAYFDPANQ